MFQEERKCRASFLSTELFLPFSCSSLVAGKWKIFGYFSGILLCVVSRVLGTEGGAVPDMQGGDVSLFFPTLTSHSIEWQDLGQKSRNPIIICPKIQIASIP